MTPTTFARNALLWAAVASFAGSCAKVGSPTGGPEDEVPPVVIATEPADSSVSVSHDTRVRITFSERMSPTTVEEALFISPYPDPYPYLHWSSGDRKLELRFPERLDTARTYVLTIGTRAADGHNVPLAEAYTFAFATGDRLDEGEISGEVWAGPQGALRPAIGVSVGLFPIDDDTTSIHDRYADYETQTGDDGGFTFSYLAPGEYRVVAWQDRTKDYLAGSDEPWAVPASDASAAQSGAVLLPPMLLSDAPPSPPDLLLASAPDAHHLSLRFSEAVSAESLSVNIVRPDSMESAILVGEKPDREILSWTAAQAPETEYGLDITLRLSGEKIRWSADTTAFLSSTAPDTTGPTLRSSSYEKPLTGAVLPGLVLRFDDALGSYDANSLHMIADSARMTAGSARITGTWERLAPNVLMFHPQAAVPEGSASWLFPLTLFEDAVGNRGADTATVSITRVAERDLGTIAGSVADPRNDDGGRVFVRLSPVTEPWTRVVAARGDTAWSFENVPAMAYVLFVWRDRNGDGRWSPGSIEPFAPSERWSRSDTLSVRARWSVGGVELTLPE